MSGLHLYCVQGGERGRSFALTPGTALLIGRHLAEPGLSLDDSLASRRHARLDIHEHHLLVEDLGSSNGTRVNGRRIEGSMRIEPGDIITIGHTSLLLEDPAHRSSTSSSALLAGTSVPREPVTGPIRAADSPAQGDGSRLLLALLADLPLAVLRLDREGRTVLANDLLKQLAGLDVSAGRAGDDLVDRLAEGLERPPELHGLLAAGAREPRRLACLGGGHWLAWACPGEEGTSLFVLPERLVERPPPG